MIKKETVYFTGAVRVFGQVQMSIDDAQKKKSEYLTEIMDQIAKIDDETIQFVVGSGNNNNICAIITLSYYLK